MSANTSRSSTDGTVKTKEAVIFQIASLNDFNCVGDG